MKTRQKTLKKIDQYPRGVFLKTERGYFFVMSPTQRYLFVTKRVLDSWQPLVVVEASESDPAVKKLKITASMKFRDGSLLYSQADGKMYLISNHKARHIVNPDILPQLGLRRQDAVWVSLDEINLQDQGEQLK